MNPLPKLISKTKLMRGYQCLKSIYLSIHHKELETAVSVDQQFQFDQSHFVSMTARTYFPGGILIDNKPWDFFGALKKTRELLAQKTELIYEAAFEYKGCYARADIIKYNPGTQRWIIYEIKSSAKIKDEHLADTGLQAWIMANSGLPIEQINIMHLNPINKFPKTADLFLTIDVTEQLRKLYPSIAPKMTNVFSVLNDTEIPEISTGEHCKKPNPCSFIDYCSKNKKGSELNYNQFKSIEIQKRIQNCDQAQSRFVDSQKIKSELAKWQYPLVFLDFETINPAIPKYNGTSPYQQVPYQFSIHILNSADAEIIHHEYLHTDSTDPRDQLIPRLLKACGGKGSIVAYYAKFESDRITEMAEYSEHYKNDLIKLLPRMVDPLPIIRDHIYDHQFKGSFSLKSVAPALLGEEYTYNNLTINNGLASQRAFVEMIDLNTTADRKLELIKASLEYCKQDTFVLYKLVQWMEKV